MCGERQEKYSEHSLECLAKPEDRSTGLCVTGTLGGIVAVWDLGILDIQLNEARGLLPTAGDDGTSRLYDVRIPS